MAVEHPGTPPHAHTAAHGHSLGAGPRYINHPGSASSDGAIPLLRGLGAKLRNTTSSSSSLPLLQEHGMGGQQPLFQTLSHLCPQPGATDGTSTDLGGPLHPQNVQLLSTHKHVCTCLYLEPGQGPDRIETVTMGWCKSRARCQEVFCYRHQVFSSSPASDSWSK